MAARLAANPAVKRTEHRPIVRRPARHEGERLLLAELHVVITPSLLRPLSLRLRITVIDKQLHAATNATRAVAATKR
jgi:hypothetical protein